MREAYSIPVLCGHLLESARKRQVTTYKSYVMIARYLHEISGSLQKLSTNGRFLPNRVSCKERVLRPKYHSMAFKIRSYIDMKRLFMRHKAVFSLFLISFYFRLNGSTLYISTRCSPSTPRFPSCRR